MSEMDSNRLTLRGVEVFVAVVQAGTLGEAARRLGAAASTISQQITNLETALGVSLIDRRARPFALTTAGRLFHARALRVVDELGRARSELAELDLSAVRELRLALLEDFDGDVLPELLVRLATTFPSCNFVARTGYSHDNLAALEGRVEDLAICADVDSPPDWLERHPVVRDALILVTAPGVKIDDLENSPMIRFHRSQHIARLIEAHLRRVRLTPPRRFEVETNKAMVAMVARSEGWAITTPLGLLSSGWKGDRVSAQPLPFAGLARHMALCARRDVMGALPGAVAVLLREVVRERCVDPGKALMPWLDRDLRVLDVEKAEA